MNAQYLIQKLQLTRHPEGGYYRETYRSKQQFHIADGKVRNANTCIYFLLEDNDKSHFHRIQSDEIWFHHQGEPLEIIYLVEGEAHTFILGNDFEHGESPHFVIPGNTWFAARIIGSRGYTLISCGVAPGFDFEDFELADERKLLEEYPHLKDTLIKFTSLQD